MDDAENEAEWLIDIVVKADLEGRAPQLALQFDQSELKKVCASLLRSFLIKFSSHSRICSPVHAAGGRSPLE